MEIFSPTLSPRSQHRAQGAWPPAVWATAEARRRGEAAEAQAAHRSQGAAYLAPAAAEGEPDLVTAGDRAQWAAYLAEPRRPLPGRAPARSRPRPAEVAPLAAPPPCAEQWHAPVQSGGACSSGSACSSSPFLHPQRPPRSSEGPTLPSSAPAAPAGGPGRSPRPPGGARAHAALERRERSLSARGSAKLGAGDEVYLLREPAPRIDGVESDSFMRDLMKDLDPALAEEISRNVDQRVRSEATKSEAQRALEDHENAHLRQCVEALRLDKRRLQAQQADLEGQLRSLEHQNEQYRTFCEHPQAGGATIGAELRSAQEALSAVQMVTAALNTRNLELQRRLQAVTSAEEEVRQKDLCVVCLENLPNVVCLPCRHMCVCSFCSGGARGLSSCPMCRGAVEETLQVFMP